MASYDKSYSTEYTTQVQKALQSLGANLGSAGVDGKWGAYTDAAYKANKAQVDAILAGNNTVASTSAYSSLPSLTTYSAPSLSTSSYQTRTVDELLAEANGLIGGSYDQQKLAYEQGYTANTEALARSYDQARNTTQDSAVARGFGRSSYTTDAIANVGLQEARASDTLAKNYAEQLAQLETNKQNAIQSYVSQQQATDRQLALQAAIQQAQLEYQYAALNQQAELAAYQAALSQANAAASASNSTSSSTAKKTSGSTDYVSTYTPSTSSSTKSTTSKATTISTPSQALAAGLGPLSSTGISDYNNTVSANNKTTTQSAADILNAAINDAKRTRQTSKLISTKK